MYNEQQLIMFIKAYWVNRHKGICGCFEGGVVYPRDELRRLFKILKQIRNRP